MAEYPPGKEPKTRGPQVNFSVREEAEKKQFAKALEKQAHIRDATQFFQSAMQAVIKATEKGELLEWPLKFVTKPRD